MEINPFIYLVNDSYRIFWFFLLTSFIIAWVFLIFNSKYRKINLSKKLWLHPSSILDYKYFFIIFFIKSLILIPLIFSINSVALITNNILLSNFEYYYNSISYTNSIILFSIFLFLANDFSRYILHYAMHKFNFLWRFHQIHHSPKILNPLSFYRVHPIESLLFGLRYSFITGVVFGISLYIFNGKIGVLEILGISILQFIPNIFANLRHSHIPLSFGFLEKFFISPKQHQIHHDKRFLNKNFGGVLSIWDLFFKTIKYSKEVKKLHFGLGKKSKKFDTILKLIF